MKIHPWSTVNQGLGKGFYEALHKELLEKNLRTHSYSQFLGAYDYMGPS